MFYVINKTNDVYSLVKATITLLIRIRFSKAKNDYLQRFNGALYTFKVL